jgi:thiol-disulfide isomerase/thioredoxin
MTIVVVVLVVALIYKFVIKREGMAWPTKAKTMVYCHMNGCGHCKNFDPIWDEFVSKHKLSKLKYAKFEAREYSEFMDEMNVQGFPTVIAVDSDGTKIKEHDGSRTVKALKFFANSL